MNTDLAIKVESIGKKYRIGGEKASSINELISGLFKKREEAIRGFWAVKDLSFDVKQGEAIALIGKNGAGKSTLLKILSQITKPTTGRFEMVGRVSSLLEVGTGFHPELTGRENIFLNGTILGMNRHEIKSKFDEIVHFSGVNKFLDTPVKHYSSGMYVRLAFSVAAHLEPEILIVDEVLAVGDTEFQKKCLGKMGEVTESGRTVLFVSHNMTAVRNLCPKSIWIKQGEIYRMGASKEIVREYLRGGEDLGDSKEKIHKMIDELPKNKAVRLIGVDVQQSGAFNLNVLNSLSMEVHVSYEVKEKIRGLRAYFDIEDRDGNILIRTFHDERSDQNIPSMKPGKYFSKATIPANLFAPISYDLVVRLTQFNGEAFTGDGIRIPFDVKHNNDINKSYPEDTFRSKLLPEISWKTELL